MQSRLTPWLSLPAGWALTHRHKSRKKKNAITKHPPPKKLNQHPQTKKQSNSPGPIVRHQPLTRPGHQLQSFPPLHRPTASTPSPALRTPPTFYPPPQLFSQLVGSPRHHQLNLHGQNLDVIDFQPFGDVRRPKPANVFRIECHNINNLPDKSTVFKSIKFVERICSPDISASLVQEIGINWTQFERQGPLV
jgi:hypothetical protein